MNVIVNGDFYGIIDHEGFTTPPFTASQFNGFVSTGPAPTVLGLLPVSGTVGGTVALTSTLTSAGTAVPMKTITFSVNGNVVGTAMTDASGTATLTGVSLGGIPAGSYPAGVSASFAGDATYAAANISAALNVGKAVLTVTANNAQRLYGDPNKLFTASYSGFVNGETLATSGITGVPDLTTTATQTSGVGTYPIVASIGSLSSNKYEFTFVPGTLNVTKAVVTVTATNAERVYGEPNPAFTATYSGFVNGETLATSGVTGAPELTTTATQGSAVGTYPIVASVGTLASSNYAFTFALGTLNLTKAVLTVTANDATRLYGQPNPLFTATYSGFVNGETLATSGVTGVPDLTTTATEMSSNGTYPIIASIGSLAANNYAFTFVPGSLHVVVSGFVGLDSVSISSTRTSVESIVLSNGPIEVNGAKITGNVVSSQSSVLLGPNSVVTGNVSAGTTITNQGTAGSLTPNHPLSPIVAEAVPQCSATAPDLNVNDPMTLASGTYCFHSITLSANATLEATGPVIINMTGVLNASGGAKIPSNLQINSSYTGPEGVTISGNTTASLTIYAPGTNVAITGGSTVFGALLGKTLTISGNSQVHF